MEEIQLNNELNGNITGFDAGGSTLKVSALINGEVKFSDETVWNPKLNSVLNYHIEGIMVSFNKACEHMSTVHGVGISTTGIVVDNKIMVFSLFLKFQNKIMKKK